MSPEATAFINALRRINGDLADLMEKELRRGFPLEAAKRELARLMIETHPEVVAAHLARNMP